MTGVQGLEQSISGEMPTSPAVSRVVFPRTHGLQVHTSVDELEKPQTPVRAATAIGVPKRIQQARKYFRIAYAIGVAGLCAAVFTTPRTYVLDSDGGLSHQEIVSLSFLLFFALVTFLMVQGSNPGYISLDGANLISSAGQPRTAGNTGLQTVELSIPDHDLSSSSPRSASEHQITIGLGPSKRTELNERAQASRIKQNSGENAADKLNESANANANANAKDGVAKWVETIRISGDNSTWAQSTGTRGTRDDDFEGDDDAQSDVSDDFELDMEPDEAYDEALGHVSRSRVPPRAKYCRNSQCYVATFDHYCGVIGTCIGEKNHCRFWWFLLIHTIGLIHFFCVVHSGFRDTKAEVGEWLDYNTHALVMFIIVLVLLIATGTLLVFHSFLACAAMTTYEFMNADRISYLEGTRDFDLPFSRGLSFNVRRFCILDGIKLFCVATDQWRPRAWARAT